MDLLKMGTQFDWKIICWKQWRIEWTTRWSLLKSGHTLTFSFADSEQKSRVPIIFWQSSCCILLNPQPITWVEISRQLRAYCEEIYVFILLIMWMNWGQTIIEKRDFRLLWLKLKRSFKSVNLRRSAKSYSSYSLHPHAHMQLTSLPLVSVGEQRAAAVTATSSAQWTVQRTMGAFCHDGHVTGVLRGAWGGSLPPLYGFSATMCSARGGGGH